MKDGPDSWVPMTLTRRRFLFFLCTQACEADMIQIFRLVSCFF